MTVGDAPQTLANELTAVRNRIRTANCCFYCGSLKRSRSSGRNGSKGMLLSFTLNSLSWVEQAIAKQPLEDEVQETINIPTGKVWLSSRLQL